MQMKMYFVIIRLGLRYIIQVKNILLILLHGVITWKKMDMKSSLKHDN